ncbi:MAG: putative heat shock protein [Candidatus Midichloriaceae bacterium]|jgi:HSP20 family protein|nr:putative heat shock protein [Candidatus Midichloriaceae bacterium]
MALKNLILHPSSSTDLPSSFIDLQDRMNDLFNNFFSDMPIAANFAGVNKFPAISISETKDAVTIRAELPAMDEKDIKVEINQDRITISGEKKTEIDEEKETYHICELSYGKFARTIGLPFAVDPKKVKASFNKGALTISVNKPESEVGKSHSIPINAEK